MITTLIRSSPLAIVLANIGLCALQPPYISENTTPGRIVSDPDKLGEEGVAQLGSLGSAVKLRALHRWGRSDGLQESCGILLSQLSEDPAFSTLDMSDTIEKCGKIVVTDTVEQEGFSHTRWPRAPKADKAYLGEYPWMVFLHVVSVFSTDIAYQDMAKRLKIRKNITKTSICTGSIIHNQFVLTAAHCLPVCARDKAGNFNYKQITIAMIKKAISRKPDDDTYEVVDIGCESDVTERNFVNLYYGAIKGWKFIKLGVERMGYPVAYSASTRLTKGSKPHDIGLLYLPEPLQYTAEVLPVCLPTEQMEAECGVATREHVKVSSYGWTSLDQTEHHRPVLHHFEYRKSAKSRDDVAGGALHFSAVTGLAAAISSMAEGAIGGDSGSPILVTRRDREAPLGRPTPRRVFQMALMSSSNTESDKVQIEKCTPCMFATSTISHTNFINESIRDFINPSQSQTNQADIRDIDDVRDVRKLL